MSILYIQNSELGKFVLKQNIFIAYRLIKSKNYKFFSLATNIAILGISISVAVLILALQILEGFEDTIFTSAAQIDAQIKITGYGKQNLNENSETEKEIEKTLGENFLSLEKFLSKYVILKSRKNSDGAILTGINGEITKNNLGKFIVEGRLDLQKNGIVLGKSLADKLSLRTGDKLTIIALKNDEIPSAENPPNIMQFEITGIFQVGMPYYDNSLGFVSFENAQKIFSLEQKISGYNVFLKKKNEETIERETKKLREILPYPYYARSIFSVHRNIFVWLALQKKPIPVVLSAITLIAMLNIIGALFLLILKRRKTIGILKTLGFDKKKILYIFVFQGFFISFSGISAGVLLSIFLTFLQNHYQIVSLPGEIYFIDKLFIAANLGYYILVVLGASAVGLLTSLIPSRFAAKVSPIDAIRNG